MANNGVTFALGLAQKAGKLASGDYAVRSALKNGKLSYCLWPQMLLKILKKICILWQRCLIHPWLNA